MRLPARDKGGGIAVTGHRPPRPGTVAGTAPGNGPNITQPYKPTGLAHDLEHLVAYPHDARAGRRSQRDLPGGNEPVADQRASIAIEAYAGGDWGVDAQLPAGYPYACLRDSRPGDGGRDVAHDAGDGDVEVAPYGRDRVTQRAVGQLLGDKRLGRGGRAYRNDRLGTAVAFLKQEGKGEAGAFRDGMLAGRRGQQGSLHGGQTDGVRGRGGRWRRGLGEGSRGGPGGQRDT